MAALAVLAALLAAAVVTDVRERRIPNALNASIGALFLVVAGLHGDWSGLGWGFAAGLAGLALGALAYRFGVWGGGDAKMLAALAMWTGFAGFPRLLLVISVAGGILALWFLIGRRMGRYDAPTLPYGVAIAVGGGDWILTRILF